MFGSTNVNKPKNFLLCIQKFKAAKNLQRNEYIIKNIGDTYICQPFILTLYNSRLATFFISIWYLFFFFPNFFFLLSQQFKNFNNDLPYLAANVKLNVEQIRMLYILKVESTTFMIICWYYMLVSSWMFNANASRLLITIKK